MAPRHKRTKSGRHVALSEDEEEGRWREDKEGLLRGDKLIG